MVLFLILTSVRDHFFSSYQLGSLFILINHKFILKSANEKFNVVEIHE